MSLLDPATPQNTARIPLLVIFDPGHLAETTPSNLTVSQAITKEGLAAVRARVSLVLKARRAMMEERITVMREHISLDDITINYLPASTTAILCGPAVAINSVMAYLDTRQDLAKYSRDNPPTFPTSPEKSRQ
ncbi:MAG: hypothetical protein WEA04_01835 [Candidatus Andersenbacteria bacterium]